MYIASRILQILDHVGISFLIAGSYTPLLLISSHHQMTARFIVIFEWLAALFGTIIASKWVLYAFVLITQTSIHTNMHHLIILLSLCYIAISDLNSPSTTNVELTLFVVMGVAPVLFWSDLTENLCFHAIVLYCLGGASYLVGIPFFILGEIQPVYHVVWHIFVALGATFHWFLVYVFILKTDITSISAMSDAMTGVMASMQHTLQNVTDMVYH